MKKLLLISLSSLILASCATSGGYGGGSNKNQRITTEDLERSVRVNYELGTSYIMSANYDVAEDKLMKVVTRSPDFPDVYNALGVLQQRRGKITDASTFFAKAISLDPEYEQAMTNYTRLQCEHGGLATVASAAQGAQGGTVQAGLYAGAAECAIHYKEPAAALQYANNAISIDPRYAPSYLHKARAFGALRQGAEGLSALNQYHDLKGYTLPSAQLGEELAKLAKDGREAAKYKNVIATQFGNTRG